MEGQPLLGQRSRRGRLPVELFRSAAAFLSVGGALEASVGLYFLVFLVLLYPQWVGSGILVEVWIWMVVTTILFLIYGVVSSSQALLWSEFLRMDVKDDRNIPHTHNPVLGMFLQIQDPIIRKSTAKELLPVAWRLLFFRSLKYIIEFLHLPLMAAAAAGAMWPVMTCPGLWLDTPPDRDLAHALLRDRKDLTVYGWILLAVGLVRSWKTFWHLYEIPATTKAARRLSGVANALRESVENLLQILPQRKWNEHRLITGTDRESCAICVAPFKERDVVTAASCHNTHVFHRKCLKGWINQSTTCPICRATVFSPNALRKFRERHGVPAEMLTNPRESADATNALLFILKQRIFHMRLTPLLGRKKWEASMSDFLDGKHIALLDEASTEALNERHVEALMQAVQFLGFSSLMRVDEERISTSTASEL